MYEPGKVKRSRWEQREPQGKGKFKISSALAQRRYRARNEQKYKARDAVHYALRIGELTRGECIDKSDSCRGRIQAHHHKGYEREHWLDVIWICHWHHYARETTEGKRITNEPSAERHKRSRTSITRKDLLARRGGNALHPIRAGTDAETNQMGSSNEDE